MCILLAAHRRKQFHGLFLRLTHLYANRFHFLACPSSSPSTSHNSTLLEAIHCMHSGHFADFLYSVKLSINQKQSKNTILTARQYFLSINSRTSLSKKNLFTSSDHPLCPKPSRSAGNDECRSAATSIEFKARDLYVLIVVSAVFPKPDYLDVSVCRRVLDI